MSSFRPPPCLVAVASCLFLACVPDFSAPGEMHVRAPAGSSVWPDLASMPEEGTPDPEENPWLSGFGTAPSLDELPDGAGAGSAVDGLEGESEPLSGESAEGGEGKGVDLPAPLSAPEVVFLAYKEGHSSDKRLTLLSRASRQVSCEIEVYSNGGSTPWRTLAVPALASESVFSLCTSSEAALGMSPCDAEMSGSPYNGNDALLLWCDGFVTDRFGDVGVDPGLAWSAPSGVSSLNQALVRCEDSPAHLDSPFDLGTSFRTAEEVPGWDTLSSTCQSPQHPGFGGASLTE